MLTITTKINKTVEKYNMLSFGDRVCVGVSGGADSMLLLTYLLEVKENYNLDIVVANVEHGIRGEESKSDSRFVKDFCKKRGVEFKMLCINAPEEAKKAGMGVEEYSRLKRYEFFNSLLCDKIAVAHNASDSAETFLFRLSRGTGINGASGIKSVRDNIIRPLIELSSDEIRLACKENNIEFAVDSTNFDNDYSRNYIRNVIIPDFEKLNPSFEKSVLRFVSSINEANEYIKKQAEICFDTACDGESLKCEVLRNTDKVIAKYVIILFAENFSLVLDEKHLNEVYALIFNPSKVQIKGSTYAVSNKDTLRFADLSDSESEYTFSISVSKISISEFESSKTRYQKEVAFFCDCDKICGKPYARSRKSGDSINPENRNVTKSLKKLFNEFRIPLEKRNKTAVLCDEKGIIGVAGYVCDNRVKIDKNTKSVLLISTEDKF